MPKRDLANMDGDMFSPIGKLLQQAFAHGIDNDIVQGGILSGQTALQSVYAESATQNCVLGSKLVEKESGREFHYSKAGAVALGKALMTQGAVEVSNYLEQIQTAHGFAAAATSGNVLITTGATPAADLFRDGWLLCGKGAGLGQAFPILSSSSHATIVAIVLKAGFSVQTAIAAASECSLIASPFRNTIVAPVTTLTASPAGVPLLAVTAAYYYWAQTKGPCAMTVDTGDTVVIGEPCGSPGTNAVAGTVGIATTVQGHYGKVMAIGSADESCLVNLDLGY